ncbi:MAG: RHS repeat-associated core domain-containing protein [Velocimicrobium sp.]
MKLTFPKLLRTIILALIFSMTWASTCHAEVDIDALKKSLNGVTQQQINQCNNPKYAERNNTSETVDPITGNLIIKENDLSLPGKDGLDLDIARLYNSSQDEYEKRVDITTKVEKSQCVKGYVLDVLVYNKITQETSKMVLFKESFEEAEAERLYYLDGYDDGVHIYTSESIRNSSETKYTTSYTLNNRTDKFSYNITRYLLGAGWSFGFPSVQIDNEFDQTYLYFHDGSGAAYRVNSTSDVGESNLEGYPGSDVKFLADNASYVNLDGISSTYKFISSDLTTTFFGSDGRILGIKDRFNNEIKFRYQNVPNNNKSIPLISQIIDSVGRTIRFSYNGDNIELTVSVPNETNPIQLTYKRSFHEQSVITNGVSEKYTYPTLDSVVDPLKKETFYKQYRFNSNLPTESYSYTSKDIKGQNERLKYLLGEIDYPGSKTLYQYEKITRNLGADGATNSYRVKERHDEILRRKPDSKMEGIKCNHIDYSYAGDCSGYPTFTSEEAMLEPDAASYQFQFTESIENGLVTTTTFNGKKQILQVETIASNKEKQVVKNLEFDNTYASLPTKKEYTEYTANGTLAHTYYSGTTYTPWGGIASQTDAITAAQYNNPETKSRYTTTYSYDNATYKYFITKMQWFQSDSVSLSESYSYTGLGRNDRFTNAKGEETQYKYYTDFNSKIVQVIKQLENNKTAKTSIIYGSETGFAYPREIKSYYTDSQGAINSVNTKYTYNMLLGLVSTETDNENKMTSYSYDNYGRVTRIQEPDFTNINGNTYGVRQEYSYKDAYNEVYCSDNYKGIYGTTINACTVYVDKAKKISSYYNQYSMLYDSYGDLRMETDNSTGTTKSWYNYDTMQRAITAKDAVGNTTTQSYDVWGEVNEITDAGGNLYVYEHDSLHSKNISYFVAKNNIANYRANKSYNTYKEDYLEERYDQFGRTFERKVYENWPSQSGELFERYRYDIEGNLIGYTDPKNNQNENGVTTSYQYDALNRISSVKNAENQVTNINYTALGDIATVAIMEGSKSINIYTKTYDEFGNIISKKDNKDLVTSYSYNRIGLRTKVVDRNNNVGTYSYDGLDHLMASTQTKSDGTSIGYKYNYTNPFGCSEVQLYNNGTLINQELYNYNSSGQVIQRNSQAGFINSNLNLQYDDAGKLLSVGTGVQNNNYFYSNYTYTNERLTKVQTNGQQSYSADDKDNATYEYYPDGKLKKITYPKLNDDSYLTTEYCYNSLGRMTSMVNKKNWGIISSFTYTYDSNGNITSVNDGLTTKKYVYDKLNRLIEFQHQNGKKVTYSYDYRGNRRTEVGGEFNLNLDISYSYDLENRLKTVTKGTSTIAASMSYYADGMRAKKATPSGVTNYIYDLSGKLVAEAVNSSTVTANYIWGPDRVLEKKDASGEYYYLYNGHGDVVRIVDRNGKMVNNYEYDEWGNILYSKETVSNPFKYTCEVYDQETGLYYLNARYYDPKLGRFINEDTYEGQINNPLSLNGYSYCSNNPLIYSDPSGHVAQALPIIKGGLILGGIALTVAYITSPEARQAAKDAANQVKDDAKATYKATKKLVGNTVDDAKKSLSKKKSGDSSSKKEKKPDKNREVGKTNEKGVGGKGWRGDNTWKKNVNQVKEGGTIKDLNGQVPTKVEAEALIRASGGKVNRVEGPHEAPNPHNYNHINYTTPWGGKGTIRIK